jgi:hypothetical protein
VLNHNYSRVTICLFPDLNSDVVWQLRKLNKILQRLSRRESRRSSRVCSWGCQGVFEPRSFADQRGSSLGFRLEGNWRGAEEVAQPQEAEEVEEIQAPDHVDPNAFISTPLIKIGW